MPRRALAACALTVAPSVASAWAPATTSNGHALQRVVAGGPIRLADADLAWTRAALSWSSATPAAFTPVEGTSPSAPDPNDGVTSAHDIASAEAWRALVGDDSVVAFTLLTIDAAATCADACPLVDADVVVNTASWRFSTTGARDAFDREAVLAHEVGHVLGLGHACTDAGASEGCEALMAPVVTPGPAQVRAPVEDDIAGATAWLPVVEVVRIVRDARSDTAADTPAFTGVARWRPWRSGSPGEWAAGGGRGAAAISAFAGADFVEAWSVTGHGAALAVEAAPEPLDAGALVDASAPPTVEHREPGGGCQAQRGPSRWEGLLIAAGLLLLCGRSVRRFR